MVSDEYLAASAALAEVIEPTPKDAAEWAARYEALRQARRITADGDVLTEAEYQRERDELNKALKEYIDRNGALDVEGVGELFVLESHDTSHDLAAIRRDRPEWIERAWDQAILTINEAALKAQMKAGQIDDPGHAMKMIRSRSLQVNQRDKR